MKYVKNKNFVKFGPGFVNRLYFNIHIPDYSHNGVYNVNLKIQVCIIMVDA